MVETPVVTADAAVSAADAPAETTAAGLSFSCYSSAAVASAVEVLADVEALAAVLPVDADASLNCIIHGEESRSSIAQSKHCAVLFLLHNMF